MADLQAARVAEPRLAFWVVSVADWRGDGRRKACADGSETDSQKGSSFGGCNKLSWELNIQGVLLRPRQPVERKSPKLCPGAGIASPQGATLFSGAPHTNSSYRDKAETEEQIFRQ